MIAEIKYRNNKNIKMCENEFTVMLKENSHAEV